MSETDIAIVGMAARLPGAKDIETFWKNLAAGKESVEHYTDEQLIAEGESRALLAKPNYVRASAPLGEMEMFDPDFFGFSPKEAAILDPQHRHFLEACWEALEDAGHPPERFKGPIGVFGGCGMGSYFYFHLCTNPELVDSVGLFLLRHTGNDKDFLVTRVSYLLDLKGPSVNVQTACSTSLVATHLACQSLLSGECDMALAGGVTIELPHRRGYLYHPGEVLSPDGHCHAFDHRGQGTVFGSGAGVVVLRRLQDALDDGDQIRAVIKGSAVNNDGAGKVGYLAPSVDGQSAAMAEAHSVAGIGADSLQYVECHGTGTYMGDPIEIAALTQAFRRSTQEKGFCRIGSVKTNIGHLDTAAGVASLIKVTLALQNRQIPPSLNFEKPNPTIDFANSPFVVNTALTEWTRGKQAARRAAVNSLGVGGTNAHVVVEEAPERPSTQPSKRSHQLLVLSARSRKSLDEGCQRLATHLETHPEQELADVAFTLFEGRRAFDQRRVLAVKDRAEAIDLLRTLPSQRVFTHVPAGDKPEVVFMLPGGGAQYAGMARDLYAEEPIFREHLDRGLNLLEKRTGTDLRKLIFPAEADMAAAGKALEDPPVQLPAIFVISYAVAKLWMSRGVEPSALIGHSVGENTAACLAGVMSYEDCLGLVRLRGELVMKAARGGVLSVPLSPKDLEPFLEGDLDLAIINGPELCAVSGPEAQIDELEKKLAAREVDIKRVKITVAAHSRLLEPILGEFGAYLEKIKLSPPKIPIVSNRSGTWMTKEEATDPQYWVKHLRHTVRFADGLHTLLEKKDRVFLEAGPGRILSSLVRQHPSARKETAIVASLRHPDEKVSDAAYFLTAHGRLWAAGLPVGKEAFWKGEKRRKVALPTYAFQHQRYWIEPGKVQVGAGAEASAEKLARLDDWFYRPVWREKAAPAPDGEPKPLTWLVFEDAAGLARKLSDRLRKRGHTVVTVAEGDAFRRVSDQEWVLSPEHGREGYDALVRDLVAGGKVPNRVLHSWMVTHDEGFRPGSSFFHRNQERGFYSLFFLAQAMNDESVPRPMHWIALSSDMQAIGPEAVRYPDKATMLGPIKVVPRELAGVTCASVDVSLAAGADGAAGNRLAQLYRKLRGDKDALDEIADQIEPELHAPAVNALVALRGGKRFEEGEEKRLPDRADAPALKDGGVYLITGGLGGLGLVAAEEIARRTKGAKLVLLGRGELPPRDEWDRWLVAHGTSSRTSARIAKIRAIEAMGAEVMTAAADVTDVEGMRDALEKATARFGKLNGLIHTAGVVMDALIPTKSLADVETVFGPKVHGTQVLDGLLEGRGLDFIAVYSSTSTILAPPGQVDYVAANAFLDAWVKSKRGKSQTRHLSIKWGIWNEVGLAAESLRPSARKSVAPPKPTAHPLFAGRTVDHASETALVSRWSVKTQWLLDEHRTRGGHALIPGTGYLELAGAALAEYGEKGPFELRDLYFFRPLHVPDDAVREVRTKLKRTTEGYRFEVKSAREVEGRTGWELHAQADLVIGGGNAGTIDVAKIEARCTRRKQPAQSEPYKSPQEDQLRFGPRWRVLRSASHGEGEAIARLSLDPRFARDLADYPLHPALMDIATGFGLPVLEGWDPGAHLWVPLSYKRVAVHAPLTAEVWSWARARGQTSKTQEVASFDVTIADASGNVLVEVEAFTMKRVPVTTEFALAAPPSRSELEMPPEVARAEERALSPAEKQLEKNLARGILPREGGEALIRALQAPGGSEIVVTSMDLAALLAETEKVSAQAEPSGTKFARPALDSEYVAPRDEVERTIAGFWEELLGVDNVGVEDSFFDLGGHSLIAVRLFAMIKKAYHVDYPISVLFEAPTVSRCARMIKEAIGHSGEVQTQPGEATDKPRTHKPRFTHLVAMHAGEGGDRRPFFLVAGMFGNVLNLRHLAHLIGVERPVYGLQARGLYGDQEPHETFEEMARDYLAEVRSVQPRGPYLLGGFSGGGITAYEMAQQLLAEGEEVSLLVMLDSRLPQSPPITKADKAKVHLQRLQKKGAGYLMEWGQNRVKWEVDKLKKRFGEEVVRGETEFHNEAIEAAFRRALGRYEVRPYPGKLTLFRPRLDRAHVLGPNRVLSSELEFVYHDNDWGRHAGAIEVHEVPGNHDSMVLEPNVRVMATRLRHCIDRADTPTPDPARPEQSTAALHL